MLSIGKLAAGQADYYLNLACGRVDRPASVASGVEDYYEAGTEAPGLWMGSLADELGKQGRVDGGELKRILEPDFGGGRGTARKDRVPGFDLTFSAPKSVSVLYGVGSADLQKQIGAAHREAVGAALGYLEQDAVRVRRGRNGRQALGTDGFVAAGFDHRTSRAGDPQLHTHVLVANRTRGTDGRWSSLDSRRLYRHAKTAGFIYQAVLRSELTRAIGVEWSQPTYGVGEVVGAPPHVLRAFSRRRAEIVAELERLGTAGRAATQAATLATRRAKDYRVSPEQLMPDWRARAEELGFGREELAATLGRTRRREGAADAMRLFSELLSPSGLTARRSTFTRRGLLQALAERADPGLSVTVRSLDALADSLLRSSEIVRVTEVGETRYSVRELVHREQQLVLALAEGHGAAVGVATETTLQAALERRPTLSSEQRAMVERLVRGGDRIQVVVGRAGTGKTFALDAAREAWEHAGVPVIGAAVARRASRELEEGAGIRSTSLYALLEELREPRVGPLPRGTVVVVDEAGMVPTRDLHELAHHVSDAEGKLVLVGDPRQLPEIQAGGAFAALAVRGGAVELKENRRQGRAWEREALSLLRAGYAAPGLAGYATHGHLTVASSAEQVRERLVADWWTAREDGEALMIAFRRSDVADLNRRARARMRAAGRIGDDDLLEVGGAQFALGDQVVIRRGSRRLGVVNGDRGAIVAADPAKRTLVVRVRSGRDVTLDAAFMTSGIGGRPGLQHGYAVTGHVAQGLTTDRTFVLGTNRLFREWGYVAMSRGRLGNRMYAVVGEPSAREEIAPGRRRRSPFEDLVGRLERSERQLATVDAGYAAEFAELGDAALRAQIAKLRLARLRNRHDPELRARTAAAREELHRRAAWQSRAAALSPASHLAKLGGPPDGLQGRAAWEATTAAVERYRLEYDIDHPAAPLGERPKDPAQLVAWQRTQRELGRQRDLGREASRP